MGTKALLYRFLIGVRYKCFFETLQYNFRLAFIVTSLERLEIVSGTSYQSIC